MIVKVKTEDSVLKEIKMKQKIKFNFLTSNEAYYNFNFIVTYLA